jgi:hypothetical protein
MLFAPLYTQTNNLLHEHCSQLSTNSNNFDKTKQNQGLSIVKKNILKLFCAITAVFAVSVSQSHAVTIDLTLASDKDPLMVTSGEQITFTVGITPLEAIAGYTLDIRYDQSELDFISSAQLVEFFGNGTIFPYTLDPATTAGDAGSTGLATSSSGRAALLSTFNSDPVGALFSLTFTVLTPVADSLADLEIGLLNTAADDISPPIGGEPFDIATGIVSAEIAAIPVPAAVWLFGSGLLGLFGVARKQMK